jgi:lipoate-protein ligase A
VSPAQSYVAIHEEVVKAMWASGIDAAVTPVASERNSAACFENPVAHDVVLGGRKIAGAAQRRTRKGLLHQGSIQGAKLAGGFAEIFLAGLSAKVSLRVINAVELADAQALAAEKYTAAEWTRRF